MALFIERFRKAEEIFLDNTEELLFVLSRSNLSKESIKRAIAITTEGLYWTRFCELSGKQGVAALIYDSLRKIEEYVRFPQFVKEKLKISYLHITAKNTAYYEKERDILELFFNNDIPVIPLKGMFLSKRLYGDIAGRGSSVDFDLLIEEKNKEQAQILLEEAGYSFNPDNEIKQWQWQYVFSKPKAEMIDLHWDITMMRRSYERIEGLWKGTRLAMEDGISYYEFKEEELLLYLSAHLVNSDSFRQLRYVCDIDRLLRKYGSEINWERLMEKAKKWQLSGSLYTALKLSKDFFSSKFPEETLSRLRLSLPKRLFIGTFVNRRIVSRGGLRRRFLDRFLSYILFELVETTSFKDYLAVFKRVFFPPKEVMGKKSYIARILKGGVKLLKISPKHLTNMHK